METKERIKAVKADIVEKLRKRHPDIPAFKLWEVYKSCGHIMVELMLEGYVVGLLYKGITTANISLGDLEPRKHWNLQKKCLETTQASVRFYTKMRETFPAMWREFNGHN